MNAEPGWVTLANAWSTIVVAVATVVLAAFGWVQIHIARADRDERRQREADELLARATYLSARLRVLESLSYAELKGNMAALWTDDDERALIEAARTGGSVRLLSAINGVRALHGLALHLQGVRVMLYEPGKNASAQMLNASTWNKQVEIARHSLDRIAGFTVSPELAATLDPPGLS